MGAIVKWAPEHEQELVRLFQTKFEDAYFLSHSLIGSMLKKSRPAVVGKIHRLKLTRDPTVPCKGVDGIIIDPQRVAAVPRTPATYGRSRVSRPPRAPSVEGECIHAPSPHAIQLSEIREDTCRFPIGHVGAEGFHFCGDKVGSKKPYCNSHARLCYVPLKARQEQRPTYSNKY